MTAATNGWRVFVRGTDADLRALALVLGADDAAQVGFDDPSGPYLSGTVFELLDDGPAALSRAQDFLDLVAGVFHSELWLEGQLRAIGVARLHQGGRRDAWTFPDVASGRGRAFSTGPGRAVDLDRLLEIAALDDTVAEVLYWHGRAPATAFTLWKTLELIRADTGGRKGLLARHWLTPNEYARLRQALNDPRILRRRARHAVSSQEPILTPALTFEEAENLVAHLVEQWIRGHLP